MVKILNALNGRCAVCGGNPIPLFELRLLESEVRDLLRCENCGFLWVPHPTWLADSFKTELHALDVGSVARTELVGRFLRGLRFAGCISSGARLIDIGGGDGLMTRQLRDRGIDARFDDPFTVPVFDVGPSLESGSVAEIGVMSEVALHFADPIAGFKEALLKCDKLLFTAVTPPNSFDSTWWYLMPQSGQHVAFYPRSAIRELALALDCDWCSDGKFFHLLSKQKISFRWKILVKTRGLAVLFSLFDDVAFFLRSALGKSPGLTVIDQSRVSARLNEGGQSNV